MENLVIKECSLKDIEKIKYISEKTFYKRYKLFLAKIKDWQNNSNFMN